jgi:hypothetical protein
MGVYMKEHLHEIGWEAWTGFMWLRIGQVVCNSEQSDESVSFVKCREFLD